MSAEHEQLTPQQRLSLSRRALIAQLQEGTSADWRDAAPDESPPRQVDGHRGHPWSEVASHVVRRWWRRHPANAAGQLARPLLERYAREQPAKLIAAAAATGALVVLIRPWRLLSITAVLAAVLKTSDVADLVTTLMKKTANPRKDAP
ncbi:hypothetical protein VAR608DRAFT_4439 [Variovorax sp. HW608]|uniref:hypothetical protein n=1 Tax=Variovorax sp. HW608 TaxID=1034889 RepID=UPI00081FD3B3|nr:hypothetical protein [Variovorax sp. HW608]SCK45464.1 hypothetical protein VAR608DRAFT_4439 [Variovorax sp. HW608]